MTHAFLRLPVIDARRGAAVLAAAVLALVSALAALGAQERSPAAAPAPVEVIVQFQPGVGMEEARALMRRSGARVTAEAPLIHGLGASLSATAAAELARHPAVKAVSPNAEVRPSGGLDADHLATSFNATIESEKAWKHATGSGVGVAVIDTGVAGDLPDFRDSGSDASRVVASAVVHPGATTAGDTHGHGTHVAGLIAGDGRARDSGDPHRGRYAGVAPGAHLVSVKVADEQGRTTCLLYTSPSPRD